MPSLYFAETYLISFVIYFIKHFHMILDFKMPLPTSVKFEHMFLLNVSDKVSEKGQSIPFITFCPPLVTECLHSWLWLTYVPEMPWTCCNGEVWHPRGPWRALTSKQRILPLTHKGSSQKSNPCKETRVDTGDLIIFPRNCVIMHLSPKCEYWFLAKDQVASTSPGLPCAVSGRPSG